MAIISVGQRSKQDDVGRSRVSRAGPEGVDVIPREKVRPSCG